MSRTKDHYIELRNLEGEFLGFLGDLFNAIGYSVEYNAADASQHRVGIGPDGPDLLVKPPSGEGLIAVELKIHRSSYVSAPLIRSGLDFLNRQIGLNKAVGGILIVTQPISRAHAEYVTAGANELWDLDRLVDLVLPHPELAKRLGELIRASFVGASSPHLPAALEMLRIEPDPPANEGERLAKALEASASGRKGKAAQTFEKLCQDALDFLYKKDFAGFKKQKAIERGYQRLDVIGRLVPVSAFWTNLAADFRTRYVIFEFKNSGQKITQDEVHSTEKYLFTSALRSVAIIVARKGASDSAKRAMRGALREQGKLILCISMADLCRTLRGRDKGDEPTDVLLDCMDEMLMAIAR
jgi:hypothetical protein